MKTVYVLQCLDIMLDIFEKPARVHFLIYNDGQNEEMKGSKGKDKSFHSVVMIMSTD